MKPVSANFISESFGFGSKAVELYKNPEEAAQQVGMSRESSAECNLWLPAAAKVYKISKNIRDYILAPVPVMFSDIPNTNGDAVTIQEMLRFDPDMGMQAFKTFRGQPCHREHANKVIEVAKGVILDVFLRPVKRYGNGRYYKLVLLMAYDRTKDPELVRQILAGEENAYSVGFYFKNYACSVCGAVVGQGLNSKPCSHTVPRRPTYKDTTGRLVYRQCGYIKGFECSSVFNPSYTVAIQNKLLDASAV